MWWVPVCQQKRFLWKQQFIKKVKNVCLKSQKKYLYIGIGVYLSIVLKFKHIELYTYSIVYI